MAIYEINNIPAPIDFECNDDLLKRTLQNAKNLLMCNMGELPYDRYRGFDAGLYHLPAHEMQQKLFAEVARALMWEPDVTLRRAKIEPLDDDGYLVTAQISVNFETENTGGSA